MKQQIENIIKKNLPKIQEHICGFNDGECVCNCFQEALSQIDTALIADEVLKVVVETLRNNIDKIQKYTGGSSVEPKDIRVKLKDVLQLLSNLSLNKENNII